MSIRPSDYIFCPYCASRLTEIIMEGISRKTCTYCKGWTHYPANNQASVGVLVRNGKVLLVQRNREPHKDTWGLPAGFVEFGEHPEEALRREVKQETGLEVTGSKFIKFVLSNEDPRNPSGHLVFFYRISAKGKIQNDDPDENQKVGWFELTELPEIGWPSHRPIIASLQKEQRGRRRV
jgi:ADP-ribose pyrophosphatase YjhB (NUDIX family)